MRRDWMLRLSALLVLLFTSTAASAVGTYADQILQDSYRSPDETSFRADIYAAVGDALWNKRFNKLEALADRFRNSKTRTPSGLWELGFYYEGVRRFYREVASTGSGDADRFLREWLEAYPDSPTPRIALAVGLIERAWIIRGTGYASTVSSASWKPFKETVEQARQALLQSKEVSALDPHWYTAMAEVGMLQSWSLDEFSALIDEALDREPLYFDTYFVAVNRYLPKWGGNTLLVEEFARQAVARTRGTEGSALYARVYWSASGGQYRDDIFEDSLADWAEMSRGIDDVVAAYPDRWNLNHFAHFACLAGDYTKMLELLDRTEGPILEEAWGSSLSYFSCKLWGELVAGW